MRRDNLGQVAFQIPFDKDNDPSCEFTKENVQEIIEELCNRVAISANPGFTWGRSGQVTTNTWLLNDSVPSNKAGRAITIDNASLVRITTVSEKIDTYDISIYEHEGDEINLTLLHTESIVTSRMGDFTMDVDVTTGRQLAVRITSGSAFNLVVGAFLRGND